MIPAGPQTSETLHGLATQGVISRSVRDTAAMLDVLAGAETVSPYAPASLARPLLDEVDQDPGPLRIGFSHHTALNPDPHPDAIAAVRDAAQLLENLGHHVDEVGAPHDDAVLARDLLTIWFADIADIAATVDSVKRRTGSDDSGFEQDTLMMAAFGRATNAAELSSALERRHTHITALARFHADHDLLLTPPSRSHPRGSVLLTPPPGYDRLLRWFSEPTPQDW